MSIPTATLLLALGCSMLACGSSTRNHQEDAGLSSSATSQPSTNASAGVSSPSAGGGSNSAGGSSGHGVGGSGAGNQGGNASSSNTGSGGSGTLRENDVCAAATPWTDEADTGFYECDAGVLWRQQAMTCPRGVTRSQPVPLPEGVDPGLLGTDECAHDDDCEDLQTCRLGLNYEDACNGGDPERVTGVYRVCEQRCQSDDDCGESMICLCDETGSGENSCVYVANPDTGGCVDDSDCTAGARCLGASHGSFVCEHPTDECMRDADCESGTICNQVFDPELQRFMRSCVESLQGCQLG